MGLFLALAFGLVAGAQSVRPGWGSIPYADSNGTGVTFRTWAPNASSVSVAGTFNGWNTSSRPLVLEGNGAWSLDVAGATPGAEYKFVINGGLWRRDPYSRWNVGEGTRNSIVVDRDAFDWGGEKTLVRPANSDLVIYELHVGAFFDPDRNDGAVGRFSDVAAKLDHLVELGINAIEMMPVSDFATTTSWGYNPSYPLAIAPSYGSPDDLKTLVKACHERGIAVLMDMVHNHWGDDSRDWALWQFDGWSGSGSGGGIYFFEESGSCCTPWGPRPDFRRAEVSRYISDSFRMWLEEYRVDGFRWDAAKYILYSGNQLTNPVPGAAVMVGDIVDTIATEFGPVLQIAEDIAGVPGFDGRWDFSYQWTLTDILSASNDADRNLYALATVINQPAGRIVYSESHDSTGDLNNGRRLPVALDAANPEGWSARKRTGLGAVFTLTSPGMPMLWMGQEMLETNVFGDLRPLDWERTNTFAGTHRLYRDLIRLRRNLDGLTAGLAGDRCSVLLLNDEEKVLAYRRYSDEDAEGDVVVIANLRGTRQDDIAVPFPRAGTWYVHANTDATVYGPDEEGAGPEAFVEASGAPPVATLQIGRYSALILSQTPRDRAVFQRLAVNDASIGNGNGSIEPGEWVLASLVVSNTSAAVLPGVSAELHARDAAVLVTQPRILLPDLAPQHVVTGASWFVFRTPSDYPCGTPVELEVRLTWPGGLQVTAVTLPGGAPSDCGTFTGMEVDQDADGLPDWWEYAYYGGATNAAPEQHDDSDGVSNLDEFRTGTNPRRADSFFTLQAVVDSASEAGVVLRWESVPGRTYRIWRTGNLVDTPFDLWRTNVPATPTMNTLTDPDAGTGTWYYRIGLE